METSDLIGELAKLLKLSPVVVFYLVYLGRQCFKRKKEMDMAFRKIREIRTKLKMDE